MREKRATAKKKRVNYYPFGLKHKGYNGNYNPLGNSTAQKFGYNGKEITQALNLNLYEYGSRMYDPAVAMFTSIDPKAEEFEVQGSYIYAANNPIFYEEKNGESADPPQVLGRAVTFLGTMYEWGGKNPSDNMVGAYNGAGFSPSFSSEVQGTGVSRGELSMTSKNLYDYYYDGQGSTQAVYNKYNVNSGCSFGIDCSGLSSSAFNADEDKLMGDLRSGTAHDQRQQFKDAQVEGTGMLHENSNLIGMGDMVFYQNKKGRITHVMVATGKVQKDKNGKVTRFQIIHAPKSGGKVEYAWRTFRKGSHSVGHTYRKGDTSHNNINVWEWLSSLLNFVDKYQKE